MLKKPANFALRRKKTEKKQNLPPSSNYEKPPDVKQKRFFMGPYLAFCQMFLRQTYFFSWPKGMKMQTCTV
jgi:hypothetical protein